MKRYFLLVLLFLLFTSGLVLSQTEPPALPETFAIEGEIGRALPRKIIYSPQREQMAVVDAYSRLLLINALDYSTIATLHDSGEYGDIVFSHDGRWLAVAHGQVMELWDTETVTLVADLTDLGSVRRLVGPLAFSSNDDILVFYGIYPAPRELRVTENDSITYPWVWHLPAARQEATSSLPGEVEALQMFDYANGFVLSPDDQFVAALPGRLRVLDTYTLEAQYEIPTARYEQDALTSWTSLTDDSIYVRSVRTNTLLQVDTNLGVLVEIPLNVNLTLNDLERLGSLEVGSIAQIIGVQAGRDANPLLQVFLGENYRDTQRYGNTPLTVTLVDLLLPPAAAPDNVLALLFVYDETTRVGRFQFSQQRGPNQMVLSPDQQHLLVRQQRDGDEYVFTYEVSTGQELRRFLPALRAIGSYRRSDKNRVLAYDQSGEIIISDFQRLQAATSALIVEDLRYSRQFDRFFFSEDGQKIITLAGTEWREWSITTGEVLRRSVVNLNGSIIATSADGYRYLTQFSHDDGSGGAQVADMDSGGYTVRFNRIPGSRVSDIYANPSWTRFLVIYSVNEYGPYYPGNQIAVYDYRDGFKWLIAGDDLPSLSQRQYGWVDDDTVFVYGQGRSSGQPARIYGVDYAPNSLPTCIMDAHPENADRFSQLWERLVLNLRVDRLDTWTKRICNDLPGSASGIEQLLHPTPTSVTVLATGVPDGAVPQCLLDRYPGESEAYTEIWENLTTGLNADERYEFAVLLCEGIGPIRSESEFDPSLGLTMFIDAETGERSSGAFQQPVIERLPLEPVQKLFRDTENRALGTALLSPNQELIAASNLPGELIVYRMLVPYSFLMSQLTATADVQLTQANLIVAQPSPSPTFNMIGTARPTLTPTTVLTPYPRPDQRAFDPSSGATPPALINLPPDTSEAVCPAESLYTVDNAPESYRPDGQLHAQILGDLLWVINPITGNRSESADIPQCERGVRCEFSPDRSWILANTFDLIYVVRPDNSDPRVLWDKRTPNPPTPFPRDLNWSGNRTLEWLAPIPVTVDGNTTFREGYLRDVLNVFPDPAPWFPTVTINEIPAQLISRQPGGPWSVVYTTYSTGTALGYKYYLYNTGTSEYQLFAQNIGDEINTYWHPTGDRLYYHFPGRINPLNYQVAFPEVNNRLLGPDHGGTWSNDGRYRAFRTDSRAQPIGVWDSWTGASRTFCLPETGARQYQGPFTWSPDNHYIALQAPLPKDEAQEGIGQHTLILDVVNGTVVDLTTGVVQLIVWAQEPGSYGDGRVVTPTPTLSR